MRLLPAPLLLILTLAAVQALPLFPKLPAHERLLSEIPPDFARPSLHQLFIEESRAPPQGGKSFASRAGQGWKALKTRVRSQSLTGADFVRLKNEPATRSELGDTRAALEKEQRRVLVQGRTSLEEKLRVEARTGKLLAIAEGIQSGKLGRPPLAEKPNLRRTSSGAGGGGFEETTHRLVRRGLSLGGGSSGGLSSWRKLRCAFGCFGPSRLPNPSGSTGLLMDRLGGHKNQGYELVAKQKERSLWGKEAQDELAVDSQRKALQNAHHYRADAEFQLMTAQKHFDEAQASVVKAFDGRGSKLTRSESAPGRLET